MSTNWELIIYDLLPDIGGSYSVNDKFATGRVYHLDDWESDDEVRDMLRDAGYNINADNKSDYDIDGDEDIIYINYTGYPLVEFRRVDAEATGEKLH